MVVLSAETLHIVSGDDIVRARQRARHWAVEIGLGLVDQTKVVTAASELARNALVHGGGGRMLLEVVNDGWRPGLRLTFTDTGPGIPDVEAALAAGFTTAGGLGLGLSGSRRLVDQFFIHSTPGKGTEVVIIKWK